MNAFLNEKYKFSLYSAFIDFADSIKNSPLTLFPGASIDKSEHKNAKINRNDNKRFTVLSFI